MTAKRHVKFLFSNLITDKASRDQAVSTLTLDDDNWAFMPSWEVRQRLGGESTGVVTMTSIAYSRFAILIMSEFSSTIWNELWKDLQAKKAESTRWCAMCLLTGKKQVHAVCSCVECKENLCAKHQEDHALHKLASCPVASLRENGDVVDALRDLDLQGIEKFFKASESRATLKSYAESFTIDLKWKVWKRNKGSAFDDHNLYKIFVEIKKARKKVDHLEEISVDDIQKLLAETHAVIPLGVG